MSSRVSPKCSGATVNSTACVSYGRKLYAPQRCRRLRPDLATGLTPLRWGTGYMLGSNRFGPFGRNAPAAFGHTGLVNIAIWADPERGLAAGLISSGKPGSHREATRYTALMDRITTEIPRVRHR
jgi:CubicO group peptidase (beta-lactamase class C family)